MSIKYSLNCVLRAFFSKTLEQKGFTFVFYVVEVTFLFAFKSIALKVLPRISVFVFLPRLFGYYWIEIEIIAMCNSFRPLRLKVIFFNFSSQLFKQKINFIF